MQLKALRAIYYEIPGRAACREWLGLTGSVGPVAALRRFILAYDKAVGLTPVAAGANIKVDETWKIDVSLAPARILRRSHRAELERPAEQPNWVAELEQE